MTIKSSTSSKGNSLEIKDVCCVKGDKILFRPLSFSVKSGQAISLTGRNGSGKTTLLRLIAGLSRLDSGNIYWNKKEMFSRHANVMKDNCYYLGHRNGISMAMTLKENLEFHAAIYHRSRNEAKSAAEYFGLSNKWHDRCTTLSAGQCRRAALAKLMLIDRPLWLLDEPYTSLDQEGINKTEQLLNRHLKRGGLAIIATHHDMRFETNSHNQIRLEAP